MAQENPIPGPSERAFPQPRHFERPAVGLPRLPGPAEVQRLTESERKRNPWGREFNRNALNPPQSRNLLPPSIRYSSRTVRADLPPAMDPLPRTMDPLPRDGAALPGANDGKRLSTHPEPRRKWKTRTLPSRYPDGVLTRAPANDRVARDAYLRNGLPQVAAVIRPPAGVPKIGEFIVPQWDIDTWWPGQQPGYLLIDAYARSAANGELPAHPGINVPRFDTSEDAFAPFWRYQWPGSFVYMNTPSFVGTRSIIQDGAYVTTRGGYGYGSCANGTCIVAPAITTSIANIPLGSLDASLSASFDPNALAPSTSQSSLSAVDLAAELFVERRYADAAEVLREHLAQDAGDTDARRALGYALLLSRQARAGIGALSAAYLADPALASAPLDLDAVGITQRQVRDLAGQVVTLANRTKSPDTYVAAAALMQARERPDLALKMVDQARAAGLEPETAAQLVQGFAATGSH